MPEDQRDFIQLNADLSQNWPVLNEKIDAPADADDWQDKPNKRELLER